MDKQSMRIEENKLTDSLSKSDELIQKSHGQLAHLVFRVFVGPGIDQQTHTVNMTFLNCANQRRFSALWVGSDAAHK